ncbi:unnamed protein product [Oikopleura dioica]|uniref:Uncharacterized protein n=1 Tax=Oikopleura dioica TaxID=34765 RepID=E4YYZ8_OIKDI|nr:unnamed protein product [Oikopleura dioica]
MVVLARVFFDLYISRVRDLARDSQQVILRSSWVRKTIINQEFEKRDKTAINLTKKKCRSTPQNVH